MDRSPVAFAASAFLEIVLSVYLYTQIWATSGTTFVELMDGTSCGWLCQWLAQGASLHLIGVFLSAMKN